MRHDQRLANQLRPVSVQRGFVSAAPGSVLIQAGQTAVLCTASIENTLPPWKKPTDPTEIPTGWLTAEYNMLPGSVAPRRRREREKVDGRTTEIQRLIGRSLRAVVDFAALGARTVTVDCEVLRANGGTRTLSVTGGFIALAEAISTLQTPSPVLIDSVAAVSVGIINGTPALDLDYAEDVTAEVDMNVVMTGAGKFVEVQGTAEKQAFSWDQLQELLRLGEEGIQHLRAIQREALGEKWPLD